MCVLCHAGGFPGQTFAALPDTRTVAAFSASDDVRALIGEDTNRRWNIEAPEGTPVVVTWSLPATPADYDAAGVRPMTAGHATHIRRALDTWAEASGITFVEVDAGLGDIRFSLHPMEGMTNSAGRQTSGFAYYPQTGWYVGNDGRPTDFFTVHGGIGGDVFLNASMFGSAASIAPGQRGYSILLHEIGHAIGLKHPFEGTPVISPGRDNGAYTIMSYDRPQGTTTLGSVDIEATRFLYGTGSVQAVWNDRADRVEISGRARSEWLLGTGLDDRIMGFSGHDRLLGKAGDDLLLGGRGRDRLFGGEGQDRLAGQVGNDRLDGGAGDDTLIGGAGHDRLAGAENDDRLKGHAGNDKLYGGDGRDALSGGSGQDRMFGGFDRDTLAGNGGDDFLFGQNGDDILIGGGGDDALKGGDGADSFRFYRGGGVDRIADFTLWQGDRLELARALTGGVTRAEVVIDRFGTTINGHAALRFADGETIILRGVATFDGLADALFVV